MKVHGLSRVKGRVLVGAGFTSDPPTVFPWCSQPYKAMPSAASPECSGASERVSPEVSDSHCHYQNPEDKCNVQAMVPGRQ